MSESSTDVVGLVLDPEFGARVSDLAQQMPVWALSSAVNDRAIEAARLAGGRVTKLLTRAGESSGDLLRRAMCAVDEHHGDESGGVAYRCLLVYGAGGIPSGELLADLGFTSMTATSYGFMAEKRPAS